MAKAVKKSTLKVAKKLPSPFFIYWEKSNYLLLILGIILLILGFYAMSIGSWDSTASLVISPIILFIAYVLIFPIAILYRKKPKSEDELNNTQ
jgi:membrane protein YdbS with pleckstrin-like domain